MKQQKFERAFEKAVSKILADNTHKAELTKQKEKTSELETQLEAAGGLLRFFAGIDSETFTKEKRAELAKDISEKLFVSQDKEEKFWSDWAKALFEALLVGFSEADKTGKLGDPLRLIRNFSHLLFQTQNLQTLDDVLKSLSSALNKEENKHRQTLEEFRCLRKSEKQGVIAHMCNGLKKIHFV